MKYVQILKDSLSVYNIQTFGGSALQNCNFNTKLRLFYIFTIFPQEPDSLLFSTKIFKKIHLKMKSLNILVYLKQKIGDPPTKNDG